MSSRCLNAAAALLLFVIAPDVEARELRVCADPNN
ncbi:quinoprotein dehydrogenase-associated putative ABC transporter substrate-binding protein, partial [Sinorhizobium meliloti]